MIELLIIGVVLVPVIPVLVVVGNIKQKVGEAKIHKSDSVSNIPFNIGIL